MAITRCGLIGQNVLSVVVVVIKAETEAVRTHLPCLEERIVHCTETIMKTGLVRASLVRVCVHFTFQVAFIHSRF